MLFFFIDNFAYHFYFGISHAKETIGIVFFSSWKIHLGFFQFEPIFMLVEFDDTCVTQEKRNKTQSGGAEVFSRVFVRRRKIARIWDQVSILSGVCSGCSAHLKRIAGSRNRHRRECQGREKPDSESREKGWHETCESDHPRSWNVSRHRAEPSGFPLSLHFPLPFFCWSRCPVFHPSTSLRHAIVCTASADGTAGTKFCPSSLLRSISEYSWDI